MMKRKSLNENEVRTILAVFSELQSKPYYELNTMLGSITIKEMLELYRKLNDWYQPKVLGKVFDEDLGWVDSDEEDYDWIDEGYESNCHCDTYGVCAGTSCPHYWNCQGGE